MKILIVDDQHGVRRVLNTFFRLKGIEALEAENGQQALELAKSETFTAAMIDVGMSGMEGAVLLEKLLEMNPGLTVILMSGTQDDERIKRAFELGAVGFIMKPFDLSVLESTVIAKLTET